MSERELQDAVLELAVMLGYLAYHTFDSRKSVAGFPDLVIVGHGRSIFIELKSAKGPVRPAQREWLSALASAGQEVHVVRPDDWPLRVQAILSPRSPARQP